MLGIVVITYNNAKFLPKQAELLKRFCKDEYELIVIDNSTEKEAIEAIRYIATDINKFKYFKTKASSSNGSDSHAFAANLSYHLLKDKYDTFLYLDHDCFPVKEFSVNEILLTSVMAGVGQPKSKVYPWPGLLFFRNTEEMKPLIDFSPNLEHGLDTGGNLYKVIEHFGYHNVNMLTEHYEQNNSFTKGQYQYYSMMCNETFMHFINGYGWNESPDNEERLNSLLNILESKTCVAP